MKRYSEMHKGVDIFKPTPKIKRRRLSLSDREKVLVQEFKDGSIKKLVVNNFMVHQRLELDFGPRVNMITGVNGSGKSALLQAIVLALGVTAKDSKRGSQSLNTFIRNDKDRADIQLTLFNGGPDAYKPEVYGTEIIFERTIRRNGANAQCVRSGQNTVNYIGVDAKKERDAICNHFNIDPTNSMNVLQQEEAKIFFSATNERRLYDHFLQGTLMKPSLEHLTKTSADQQRFKEALESKVQELENIKKMCTELEDQERRLTQADVSAKLKELGMNVKWGMAKVEKQKVDDFTSVLQKTKNKIAELESREETLMKSRDELNEKNVEIELKNADIQNDIEAETKLRDTAMKVFNTLSSENVERTKTIEKLINNINGIKKEIQDRHNEVRKMRTAAASKNGEQSEADRKTQIQKLIDSKKEAIDKLESQYSAFNTNQKELDEELNDLASQKKEIVSKKFELQRREKELQSSLNKASSRFDDCSRFGHKMIGLLERMERFKSSFGKPPIGPLGRHIKLVRDVSKDESVSKVLETELGSGLLRSFIVDNKHDYDTLKQMLTLHDLARTTVYLTPFGGQKYNVQKFQAQHQRAKSVLSYLKIESVEVFNIVVDMKKPESVLVCDRATAEHLFSHKDRVPVNATKIITPDFYEYFPPTTGNYSSYYLRPAHCGLLSVNEVHSTDQFAIENGKLLSEMKENQKVFDEICALMKQLEEKKKRSKTDHNKLVNQLASTRQDLSRLTIEQESQAQSIEKVEEIIKILRTEMEEKSAELKVVKQDYSLIKIEIEKKLKSTEHCQKRVDELRKLLIANTELERQLKEEKLEITRLAKEKKKKELELNSLTVKLKEQMRVYKQTKENALAFSNNTEINIECSPQQLKAMIAELQSIQAKNVTKDGRKLQEVTGLKLKAVAKKIELKSEVRKLSRTTKDMEEMIKERKDRLRLLLNSAIRCSKRAFSDYLRRNHMSGTYEVNRMDKTLTLKVSPTVGSNKYDVENISLATLSGGERSKTVVCLIMAFWNSMSCPFRCLDEWDVYLDDKARRTTEEVLVKNARETDHQYIFISPQTSSYVNNPEENLKVIEIQPRI